MEPYSPEFEETMRRYYNSLNEKDGRRFAGLEALRFGQGGRIYIAQVLGCSRNTVSKGAREVSGLPKRAVEQRIRKPGGGRKPYYVTWGTQLDEKFLEVLREHTAGDPMDEKVRWTNLTPGENVAALRSEHAIVVSNFVVRKLLKQHNYRRRRAQKKLALKAEIENRNEQFENIARRRAKFETAGNPIVSMDSKKKEHWGNFYRDGHLYTLEELQTYDHDFPSYAAGVIIPHSLYDLRLNVGYIQLGTSHDTSEFACDSFRWFWQRIGRYHYPHATSILWLCDAGGSNSCRQYLFKQDLQRLVNELGIEIRVAHYPTYCSKFNPIERRFFPHVTRACEGVLFNALDTVVELMRKTGTKTGLTTTVHVIKRAYEKGRKVAEEFKQNMPLVFDAALPKWNYKAIPQ